MKKVYCFDLDGTLCSNTDGNYKDAKPFLKRINKVNSLYKEGFFIKINTARGSTTGINWLKFTKSQLEKWGVKYNELIVGKKPYADYYIDDKAINDKDFF